MGVNWTYCGNNFMIYVSRIIVLCADLYTAVYHNKTEQGGLPASRRSFPSPLSYHTCWKQIQVHFNTFTVTGLSSVMPMAVLCAPTRLWAPWEKVPYPPVLTLISQDLALERCSKKEEIFLWEVLAGGIGRMRQEPTITTGLTQPNMETDWTPRSRGTQNSFKMQRVPNHGCRTSSRVHHMGK